MIELVVEFSGQTTEQDLSREALMGKLIHCLEGDQGAIASKKKILEKLPKDLVIQLRGHLFAAQKERDFFCQFRGEENEPLDDRQVMRGDYFEMLVKAQIGKQDPLAEEILNLIHDPARYNLAGLGNCRNPDLAFVRLTKGGDVIVEAVGEAKLGRLDGRALRQLRERGGFEEALSNALEKLSRITNLEEKGLKQIAKKTSRGAELLLSPFFEEQLYVPSNRDISNPESLIAGGERGQLTPGERSELIRLLKNKRVRIKKSLFTVGEVAVMADILFSEVMYSV